MKALATKVTAVQWAPSCLLESRLCLRQKAGAVKKIMGTRWNASLRGVVLAALFAMQAVGQSAAPRVFTNSLGMEFERVEPGVFTMGSGDNPKLGDKDNGNNRGKKDNGDEVKLVVPTLAGGVGYDQQPAHQVRISQAFYILNQAVGETAYRKAGLSGSAADVSWDSAAAFCEWLSRKEQRLYRLPTEAEWEYVFRQCQGTLQMSGREWVLDWHGSYPAGSVQDPAGPITGMMKVIRKGMERESFPPDASSSPWGLKPVSFRVVMVEQSTAESSTQGGLVFSPPPFCQAAVKQDPAPAKLGPDPAKPYFHVRFALPIPPDNDLELNGPLVGMDPAVLSHDHSPGLEVLPNGDVLAVYFSSDERKSESDISTRFVQARLRYGAEEWDPPELFFDFKPFNDQSGLLWTEGNTIRFLGGGRGISEWVPFKMAVSTDNGVTWSLRLPLLDAPIQGVTPQPIVNAFRGGDGSMYFAMDGSKEQSFLWRSRDNGIHWHDMGGRTGGRHSTIVPLDEQGRLLSIGGKNSSVDGWSPENTSSDWGATWSASVRSPFPALGSNQRPCLIRLANGHLCFVSDSYNRKSGKTPEGWAYGRGCFVAISTNNGVAWHIKRLPVTLPHEHDRKNGTLGYATGRQGPNGIIHVLSTKTQPCLHYEFNESWALSDVGDMVPQCGGGSIRFFTEKYSSGAIRASWSARICVDGRYLLEGTETSWYPNSQKEHEAAYHDGRKDGVETFWAENGSKVWSWSHGLESDRSTWIHYWPNGRKRIESHWSTRSKPRDLERAFFGLIADGPAYHWHEDGSAAHAYSFTNGFYAGEVPLPSAQVAENQSATGGRP